MRLLHRYLPACVLLLLLCSAGPLLGQTFVFDLAGSQEVPPLPSPTTGGCIGQLDQIAAEFMLTCSHNVASATLIHIHRAPAGANGPIAFDLGSPLSPVQATWTGMTAGDIADLLGAGLYINVHSGGRPDGEVRGQILTRTVDNFSFPLEGSQQVPPDVSAATGNCTADLSDDATMLAVDCTHSVTIPTGAHLHNAPVGVNGPIVFDFPGATSPISGIAPPGDLRCRQRSSRSKLPEPGWPDFPDRRLWVRSLRPEPGGCA